MPSALFELPGRHLSVPGAAIFCAFLVCLLHTFGVWGHVGGVAGDVGHWLHEVERFVDGEILYRDYNWPSPPLALWILGLIGKVFGTRVEVFGVAASMVFLLIGWGYARYATTIAGPQFNSLTIASGLLLAISYAHLQSAPLPVGMYTPAAPFGFLFLLAATLFAFRLISGGNELDAMGLGFFAALCILTKQDFWAPAVYLLIGSCWLFRRSDRRSNLRTIATAGGSFVFVVGLAILALVWSAGWHSLGGIFTGWGRTYHTFGRVLPSWERLVVQFCALALIGLCLCVLFLIGGKKQRMRFWCFLFLLLVVATCGLHLYISYQTGVQIRADGVQSFPGPTASHMAAFAADDRSLILGSLVWLKKRLQINLFPALFPVGLAVLTALSLKAQRTWQSKRTLLFLLGLCIASRARRGFERIDWYHFLLELPVYVFALSVFFQEMKLSVKKSLLSLFVGLLLLGGYSYWNMGLGRFARRASFDRVETTKGIVFLETGAAREYAYLRDLLTRVDPGGERPLLAFFFTGGYNYFLDRKNPSPVTESITFAGEPPAKVIDRVVRHVPPVLLLDNRIQDWKRLGVPPHSIDLRRWELGFVESHFSRFDRPHFENMLEHCALVEEFAVHTTEFALYDCSSGRHPDKISR